MRSVTLDIEPRRLTRKVVAGMEEHDLLTYASAIAFQVMTAIIPVALLVLSIMGFLRLDDLWTKDLAPQFRDQVSKDVFRVADDVVRKTLGQSRGWWLTAGLVFTAWQSSGVARAVMGALSRVYGDGRGDDRPFLQRYATSFGLGMGVAALILLAFAIARFGSDVLSIDDPGAVMEGLVFLVRWSLVLVLLATAVWVLLRFAPARPGPHHWVSFGSALCVIAWVGTSLVFGFYVTNVADYGSIFGSLATVFVALTYLYVSAVAFLVGAQVDALVRADQTGSSSGH
jgi:membrane protein